MPRLEVLDPESREFISNYRCREGGEPAWVRLDKPLNECKVTLITSSGLVRKSDTPFDLSNSGGDPTYRVIPSDSDPAELTLSIVSANWDRSGFMADVNVVFPMERLRELANDKVIGSLAENFYAFMGSIFQIDPVIEKSAPEVGRRLRDERVDIALLVPV